MIGLTLRNHRVNSEKLGLTVRNDRVNSEKSQG